MHQLPEIITHHQLHHFDLPEQLTGLNLRATLNQLKIPTTSGFSLTHTAILNTIDYNHLHQQLLHPAHPQPHLDLSHKPFSPDLEIKYLQHYHQLIGRSPVKIQTIPSPSKPHYTQGDANTALEVKKLITHAIATNPKLNPLHSPLTVTITKREQPLASGTIHTHHDIKAQILITANLGETHPSLNPDQYLIERPTGELIKQIINPQPIQFTRDPQGLVQQKNISPDLQHQPKLPPHLIRRLSKLAAKISSHSLLEQRINWLLSPNNDILLEP